MERPPTLRGLACACLWLLTAACAGDAAPDPRPLVVVSVLPQRYLVERLGGDRVRVEVMVPPGASPATWEPSLAQLRALSGARLYLRLGHPHFPFEATWLDRLLESNPGLRAVDGSGGADFGEGDPHPWVAPSQMRSMARVAHAALRRELPEQTEALDANLAELEREIAALDGELRDLLEGRRGAHFVVYHPAWGHFAREYGLEQLAIEHDGKEPDPSRLARVLEQARRLGVPVVFAQPQFDPRSAQVVADEIGAELEWIDPLAPDWPDNLRRVARRVARAAR